MNEVNVKEVRFVDGAAGVLVKKVKCDFKKLGPKFGKQNESGSRCGCRNVTGSNR